MPPKRRAPSASRLEELEQEIQQLRAMLRTCFGLMLWILDQTPARPGGTLLEPEAEPRARRRRGPYN